MPLKLIREAFFYAVKVKRLKKNEGVENRDLETEYHSTQIFQSATARNKFLWNFFPIFQSVTHGEETTLKYPFYLGSASYNTAIKSLGWTDRLSLQVYVDFHFTFITRNGAMIEWWLNAHRQDL